MSTQTEFDEELIGLIHFDIDQHDKACGVSITHNFDNCDCIKVELLKAIKQTIDKYVIGTDIVCDGTCDDSAHDTENRIKAEQRLALWGDK